DTSTWPLKCRGKPNGNWIDRADEHDGNRWAGLPCCMSTNSPERDDDVDFETDQFGGEFRNSIQVPVSKSTLDDDVSTLDITELAKALSQRIEHRAWSIIQNDSDARVLGRILGRRNVWREHQDAAQNDRPQEVDSHAHHRGSLCGNAFLL